MAQIITIGEILVEMMAKQIGQGFDTTGEFVGPFPSGAPAIFADQAARCGSPTMIVAAVGDDGFGRLNRERLRADGVDVSKVRVVPDATTGVAFVTYRADGSRDFLYHIADAACGRIDESDIKEADFQDCTYLHLMGSSLYTDGLYRAMIKALAFAGQRGSTITIDPNVRKEIQRDSVTRRRLVDLVQRSQIVFAGEDELFFLLDIADEATAVETLFTVGVQMVIIKRGARGSTLYLPGQRCDIAAYPVAEVDPTGAGDCYAGTFVACLNKGIAPLAAARLATIAGARAVTRQGPMEGTTPLAELWRIYDELYGPGEIGG